MKIEGFHHVTAITGDLQQNLDFYVGILGMRLAKRTVIQEEPSTYHLFYGDGAGSVGTGVTFFDWSQVGHDRPGSRNVTRTMLSVADDAAINTWSQRFDALNVEYRLSSDFAGRSTLHFTDPEGQRLGLVAAGRFPDYHHWTASTLSPANAIQAIHTVTLDVEDMDATVHFLGDVFGYQTGTNFASDEAFAAQSIALRLDNGGIGKEIVVTQRTDPASGFRGIGSMHHIALTISPEDTIEAWHDRLATTGLKTTDVIRRHYFDSVYIRIPGGTLFELATREPGLAIDENVNHLGETLTLPPFLENQRAEIEDSLKPITIPQVR